eukprot:CAMPEP_0185594078 /NCGR_PEP_ID=MMETSP0434-20130131/73607_1 /TAXON_ID=626734 ORGANISM="Favella taraikaensis, Strain Fe Narragansett Bay" /NCGR_SAMPLE_ID=MMETSP0434 /ASSEMBLY_ACC=CAM_ASM_000379 /LENGTH=62 /DNA_ID=CAMNT_0028221135 /DNA_START=611 /DNA_END=799 /DNA_ORIENTATION=-
MEHPKKLTWDDLDYLWTHFKICVSQIQAIPGFEDFEVTDQIPAYVLGQEEDDIADDVDEPSH